MKNNKKSELVIECQIISHNAFGYNGDEIYTLNIKSINDMELAKIEEKKVSERDRCMGTEMIFIYKEKIITEMKAREILKEEEE